MATERSTFLSEQEIELLRALVDDVGERRATDVLQVSRSAIQRLLARMPSRRGTVALVRQRLTATNARPTRSFGVADSEGPRAVSVLVVEHDVELRESIGDLLERENFEVNLAASGDEAVSMLPTVAHPCLVIADLLSNHIDGSALVGSLPWNDQFATIPVKVRSGASRARTRATPRRVVDLALTLRLVQNCCDPVRSMRREYAADSSEKATG